MDDVVAESTSAPRLYLALFGIFSILAIAIVSVGVYGVAAYLVATRRRELAVRRALGATSAAIVGLVLKEGATLALAGVAVGIPGALLLSGLVDSLLFGVTGHDPLTFTVMPVVVVVVTVVANLLPAGRAIRENPTIALRT
jgi:ABC-type antimicrobial peptide transport system permease subunit